MGAQRIGAIAALAALTACGSGGDAPVEGGVEVRVQYDSSMGVRRLSVMGVDPDGATVWAPMEVEPPLTLGPAGPREAAVSLPAPAGEVVAVVDGLDLDGQVVGSGQAVLQPPIEGPIVVRLGAPVACGDGRRTGRETCDDGNTTSGDGCSAVCTLEEDPPPPPPPEGPRLLEVERLAPFTADTVDGDEGVPVPGAALALPAPGAGMRWLVFASGVVGADVDDERSAELALTFEGEPVDRFGHQTLGDSRAGFVTFFEAAGAGEVQVVLHPMSGAATVAQLRLVAARVPDDAWAGARATREALEPVGVDLELLELDVEVAREGRYLLLGRGTLTEEPGGDTARLWLSTEDGPVPVDERGVTFSASRDARVPFFAAHVAALGPGDHHVGLRGTTSGSGSLTGPFDNRFAFRRRISIAGQGAGIPSGAALPVRLDHAAMVQAGQARADGRDVRVFFDREGQLEELPRVVDPDNGWGREDTTLWFRFPTALAADGTSGAAYLFFGWPEAGAPSFDASDLFDFYDDFDDGEIDPRWGLDANLLAPNGGQIRLPSGAELAVDLQGESLSSPLLVEARMRFVDPEASPTLYLGVAGLRDQARLGASFSTQQGLHGFGTANEIRPYEPQTPTLFHRYAIGLRGDDATFWQDDRELGTIPNGFGSLAQRAIALTNDAQVDLVYDWVRARPFIDPAPVVSLEALEGRGGVLPSRFEGLRLVALRLDALGAVEVDTSAGRVTTTESSTVTLASVEVAAPTEDGARLVLMSTRLAGENADGRKVGLCMADGQALLQTSHRINRDDSDTAGYHHIAGVVDAFPEGTLFSAGIRSPDGARVEGAASSIVVLDLE